MTRLLPFAALAVLALGMTSASAQGYWMGFQNPDGSQDTIGPNGQYYMGFRNPDGSQDTIGPNGQYYMGFQNPDGSQDTIGSKDDDE